VLKPKNVSVRGFRGVTETRRVDFQKPLVLFCGENHQGKSSLVNSLEWALYGDDCTGSDTGIRERVDWEIANRHFEPRQVEVEVELADGDGSYVVLRKLARRARRAGLQEELTLTLPDGATLLGDAATEKLGTLLGASYRDFACTVYQHQEAIRAVLTQQAKDRNDGIDRLLGLSDYRNLQDGIEAAKIPAHQRELGSLVDAFTAKIDTALQTRENDLKTKRVTALECGLIAAELNEKGAIVLAKRALLALGAFAAEAKLPAPTCALPASWKESNIFKKKAKTEIERLRAGLPEARHQAGQLQKRTTLLNLQSAYEGKKQGHDTALKAIAEFDKQNGSETQLDARLQKLAGERTAEEERQRQANARARLVREAIDFIEKAGTTGADSPCPLCGTEAANPLEHLRREWESVIERQIQDIEAKLTALKGQQASLEALIEQHKRVGGELTSAKEQLTTARAKVGKFLGKELAANDDPLALLARELDQVKTTLDGLERALLEKQQKLGAVAEDLDRLGVLHDILELEEKGKIIEQIRSSAEYRDLEELKERLAEFVGDVKEIKAAISKAATSEAQKRLTAAEKTIDGYFRRIADNPAIKRLKLLVEADARTGRNSYDFTDHDGRDLRPVLSQGDMNALALAIFLGLACSADEANRFGFVMLDDPSQSLGSRHKAKLAEVLSEVLAKKTVILSTMDVELRQLLDAAVTKERQTYLFSNWTPDGGPRIEAA
jgi:DNA repair protein SbcC/Rad50